MFKKLLNSILLNISFSTGIKIHGNLGSNQMLKRVAFLRKKIEILKKNKATQCRNTNV